MVVDARRHASAVDYPPLVCSILQRHTPHHNTPFDAESFDLFAGRMMLDSTFGHKDSVQVVEWLNMNHVNESSVVLAMPVKDGSLMLQARCPNDSRPSAFRSAEFHFRSHGSLEDGLDVAMR